jgi:3-oxoacyl-[acyl-carrier protein] reductase
MKNVIVIGGTSGIGNAVVHKFVASRPAGSNVLFTYHSAESAAEALCAQYPGVCKAVRLDLSSLEAVEQFLKTLDGAPPPEALVNCAGLLQDGLSLGAVRERLSLVATVNYLAPAMISSYVAQLMAPARRGFIVNVTSASARRPRLGNAVYGSTKAALERYTATLALEVARFKVRTLCVAPAFVDTAMFRSFAGSVPEDFIRKNVPMREILSPEDVANVVHAFVGGTIKTTGTTLTLASGELVF